MQKCSKSTHSNEQHSRSNLSFKDGKDKQQGNFRSIKRDLGIAKIKTDHDYCRVPTRSYECNLKLGVKELARQKQMETFTNSVSGYFPEMRNSSNRSFSVKNFSPDSSLLCVETGLNKQSNGRTATEMSEYIFPYVSPFQINRMSSPEIKKKECNSNLNKPSWQTRCMVLDAAIYARQKTTSYSSN